METPRMTPRDQMLSRVRAALGKSDDAPAPPVWLDPSPANENAVVIFSDALAALGGKTIEVATLAEARRALEPLLQGRRVIASPAPIVQACGIETACSRESAADAEIGVTSADFALADTGTLVFLTEPRLISLLPPRHIAVIDRAKILMSLDELFLRVPQPGTLSSSMVLATGPSRTADIEMRLVRGVHGPGDVIVVIVADVTAS
jgi:L-lactate dehydrogenase complex protein LldG